MQPANKEHTDPLSQHDTHAKIRRSSSDLSAPNKTTSWQEHSRRNTRSLVKSMALCTLLPTLVAAIYFGLIATPQYQTDMHIAIRSAQTGAVTGTLGSLLGGMGTYGQSTQDIRGVAEYIRSYSAVQQLMEQADLRKILGPENADIVTRLPDNASLETIRNYYRDHVDVVFNSDSGGLSVFVRAYTPQDALTLASAILALSEESVNSQNTRAENDMLQLTRAELAKAQEHIAQINTQITDFRKNNKDIDPASRSGAILGGISGLEQAYNEAQVELRQLSASATGDNVQIRAMRRKIAALKQQIDQEQNRLTGTGNTYSQKVADYEILVMKQALAQQAYAAALVALEKAQIEAQRQKSYVVPIVKPHLPQDAEYPQRLRGIALTFFASLLAFGIGRLIMAGVRDHMMH